MKHWIGLIGCMLIAMFLYGCAETKSGQHKDTKLDNLLTVNADNQSQVDVYVDLGGLTTSTDAETESGDADATTSVDPAVALGMQGSTTSAAAKGAEQVLEDIMSYAEQWMKKDADNVDNSQNVPPESGGSNSDAGETSDASSGDSDGDGNAGDADGVADLNDYEIVAEAACDQEMSFRDSSESTGVIQKKCVFDKPGTEYGPSFLVQWSSGNTLNVADSSKMNWLVANPDTGQKDYRKYHPQEPIEGGGYVPGTPAEVYAGRDDNSTKAVILVKKP